MSHAPYICSLNSNNILRFTLIVDNNCNISPQVRYLYCIAFLCYILLEKYIALPTNASGCCISGIESANLITESNKQELSLH